ncbi:GTP-binding protein [Candidatus Woesearchaeota archaeon]|nr:GTP-binding protein [Candidatus Woesearchaeota archaeon]
MPEKESAKNVLHDKIKELEDRIKNTKYNKKTQHAIGLYKAQLAKLKEKRESRAGIGKGKEGFAVRKTGDATVVLVGYPSVGKSTLLNAITNANSPVGAYDFTTLTVIPGLLEYNHAKIQVLDVPGVVRGAAVGTGRGKEVLTMLRSADLVLIVVDALKPEQHIALLKEVYDTGIRVNQQLPDVKITKTERGGIEIGRTVKLSKLQDQTMRSIANELGLVNAMIVIRENIDADQFIDAIEGNKKYVPAITIVNKVDIVDKDKLNDIMREIKPDLCISAERKINTEELKALIFKRLNLMRVYCKEIGKKADLDVPMIVKKDSTVKDMCDRLHRDFASKFKFARVWGSSKFPGQKLSLNYALKDEDVVEIHLR